MTFVLAEDAALKAYLQGLTVTDEANPTRPVKVWFGFPDVEVRTQAYPYITIELIDVRAAAERQVSGSLVDNDYMGTVTPNANIAYRYEFPLPYDLTYQVTSYARNPQHDRSLIFQLQKKFPSQYGTLQVPNDLGTETSNRTMILDGFLKRDMIEEGRRLFRNAFTVRVISEMTPADAGNALYTVQSVNINTSTSEIPSGFTPVQK